MFSFVLISITNAQVRRNVKANEKAFNPLILGINCIILIEFISIGDKLSSLMMRQERKSNKNKEHNRNLKVIYHVFFG